MVFLLHCHFILLNYLKKINNDLTFEIIFPKKLWPNIEKEQPDEAMQYINQHHKVFQDSTENDFGIDYIVNSCCSNAHRYQKLNPDRRHRHNFERSEDQRQTVSDCKASDEPQQGFPLS